MCRIQSWVFFLDIRFSLYNELFGTFESRNFNCTHIPEVSNISCNDDLNILPNSNDKMLMPIPRSRRRRRKFKKCMGDEGRLLVLVAVVLGGPLTVFLVLVLLLFLLVLRHDCPVA